MAGTRILYVFRDLALEVRQTGPSNCELLAKLLEDLSFVRASGPARQPTLRLHLRTSDHDPEVPGEAREVFRVNGFRGLARGSDSYLTAGSSLFHLKAPGREGEATLSSRFSEQPRLLQQRFWAFGLLKLLRSIGLYGLHAASLVTDQGLGLLVVGGSGSGKSTLAIGLIRKGWGYLSDDAVLLRSRPHAVQTLGLRQPFSVDERDAENFKDLPLGKASPNAGGRRKHRVDIREAYPRQYVAECIPQILLFPQIVADPHSDLRPIDRISALGQLLSQSGPQLFDDQTMPQHLDVLKRLLEQAASYQLRAGRDLHNDPARLSDLLTAYEGA